MSFTSRIRLPGRTSVFEVAGRLFCTHVALISHGAKNVTRKVRDDCEKRLRSVSDSGSFPSGLGVGDFVDPDAYES